MATQGCEGNIAPVYFDEYLGTVDYQLNDAACLPNYLNTGGTKHRRRGQPQRAVEPPGFTWRAA